ncbi:amidase [Burkholderia pseudomallei]|nr:amidase [Burkholderia pseudomallei]EEH26324.1 conserved hypothetical protein [Burkholderia pseudomallei Pakistan 9]ARK56932.1 amidase [Burkholderia pseudomallei]ARK60791.1 amidase [Burkholderia pseudomallei]ARK71801.1 amidase [Burkholderia pseudomallei]
MDRTAASTRGGGPARRGRRDADDYINAAGGRAPPAQCRAGHAASQQASGARRITPAYRFDRPFAPAASAASAP